MCGAAAMREPRVLYDRWRGGGGEVATEELERGAERAAAARPRATENRCRSGWGPGVRRGSTCFTMKPARARARSRDRDAAKSMHKPTPDILTQPKRKRKT